MAGTAQENSGARAVKSFRAFRIHEEDRKIAARFEELTLDDLSPGDVVVRVTYSGINYKDALAATARPGYCGATRWSAALILPASSSPPRMRAFARAMRCS